MVDAGNPGGFIGFLTQNLAPEDIEAIARRVVEIIGERLAKPAAGQVRAAAESPQTVAPEKLAYSRKDLCEALGLSSATLWRLEALGRLRPVVGGSVTSSTAARKLNASWTIPEAVLPARACFRLVEHHRGFVRHKHGSISHAWGSPPKKPARDPR